MAISKNNLYLLLIGIGIVGTLSAIVLFLHLNDTQYDLSYQFNESENFVEFSVMNGYPKSLEITIPEDTIDIVWGVEVNGKFFDDEERIILKDNRIFIDYGDSIKTVKLLGAHYLSESSDKKFNP